MKPVNFQDRAEDATAFATILTQLRAGGVSPNFQDCAEDATAFATLLTQLRSRDLDLVSA